MRRSLYVTFALVLTAALPATADAAKRPNLKLVGLSDPPATVAPGGSFEVSDTVRNAGKKTSKATVTAYYLSKDAIRGADDLKLDGTRAVASLKKGKNDKAGTTRKTLRVPGTVIAGDYFLLACADSAGKVKESSETDNCRAAKRPVRVIAVTALAAAGAPVDLPTPLPPSTVNIKANGSDAPAPIANGTAAGLTWTSTNVTSCFAGKGWSGAKPAAGSESTGNLFATATYELTCLSPNGPVSDAVTVAVLPQDSDADGVPDSSDCSPADAGLPPAGHLDATACTGNIYDANNGNAPTGAAASFSNVLVTAKGGNTLYLAIKSGDAGYVSAGNSSIEAPAGSLASGVSVGDRVNVIGILGETGGDTFVAVDAIDVVAHNNEAVLPLTVPAASFATTPFGLDAVFVRIETTSIASQAGGNWTMAPAAFIVDKSLIGTLPPFADGTAFSSIDGIADTSGSSKLLPRKLGDIVAAP